TRLSGYGYVLAAPCGLILGRYFKDAVGIDIKGHLDLRNASRGRRNAIEDKFTQRFVVGGHGAFTLNNMDLHLRLIVAGSGEDLALSGGYSGVALNERGSHTAQGFHRQGQRSDIEQQNVFHLTGQHTGLNRSADGNHLIRVDALMRLLAELPAHGLLHSWHTGHTAHQDDLVYL